MGPFDYDWHDDLNHDGVVDEMERTLADEDDYEYFNKTGIFAEEEDEEENDDIFRSITDEDDIFRDEFDDDDDDESDDDF